MFGEPLCTDVDANGMDETTSVANDFGTLGTIQTIETDLTDEIDDTLLGSILPLVAAAPE